MWGGTDSRFGILDVSGNTLLVSEATSWFFTLFCRRSMDVFLTRWFVVMQVEVVVLRVLPLFLAGLRG